MQSDIKVLNILVKHYNTTWSVTSTNTIFVSLRSTFLLSQTLTTLNLWNNQIGDQAAQYLGAALQHNTVSDINTHSLFVSLMFTFLLCHRHSSHSTSVAIKSELKVHNVLLKY